MMAGRSQGMSGFFNKGVTSIPSRSAGTEVHAGSRWDEQVRSTGRLVRRPFGHPRNRHDEGHMAGALPQGVLGEMIFAKGVTMIRQRTTIVLSRCELWSKASMTIRPTHQRGEMLAR